MLSLAEAIRLRKISDFIAQEEARGIGPADETPLLVILKEAAKAPQSEDQTSHSPSDDSSTGK